jgi:hypothetical protein
MPVPSKAGYRQCIGGPYLRAPIVMAGDRRLAFRPRAASAMNFGSRGDTLLGDEKVNSMLQARQFGSRGCNRLEEVAKWNSN